MVLFGISLLQCPVAILGHGVSVVVVVGNSFLVCVCVCVCVVVVVVVVVVGFWPGGYIFSKTRMTFIWDQKENRAN